MVYINFLIFKANSCYAQIRWMVHYMAQNQHFYFFFIRLFWTEPSWQMWLFRFLRKIHHILLKVWVNGTFLGPKMLKYENFIIFLSDFCVTRGIQKEVKVIFYFSVLPSLWWRIKKQNWHVFISHDIDLFFVTILVL